MCQIINDGDEDLVLTLTQSSDNGLTDAFTTVNMRRGGATVASITIVPLAKAVFTVEAQTEQYLLFSKNLAKGTGRLQVLDMLREFDDLTFTEVP
ncbi:MAG: hypothetical protein DRP42_04555 [Tenericutes bacterium]|nr:MAG: hypothetical protein DRP42_04555 [Mycoplasmatota bacterium]